MSVGIIIMAVFAAIWWIVGTMASHHGSIPMYVIAVVISGIFVVLGLQLARKELVSPNERARRRRLVRIASGIEGLAMFIAIIVLVNMKRQELIAPVMALIVGLHFFPLAYWLPARIYYLTGIALVTVAIVSVMVMDTNVRIFSVGLGAASILWLTCGAVLWHQGRNISQNK